MTKQTNYSYSRLQTYKQCPFCYNLKYNQKKFLETPSLAIFVGSLVHYIEEHISLHLRDKGSPNYKELRELLYDINIPKKYKFDDTEENIASIIEKIKFCLNNYRDASKDYEEYRRSILSEKAEFISDVKKLFIKNNA